MRINMMNETAVVQKKKSSRTYVRKTDRQYAAKTGRPTTFKPEYCEDIIDFMSTGKSFTQWCASKMITRDTATEWMYKDQNFADSYKIAKHLCEAAWECKVQNSVNDRSVNFGVLKMYMGHRFKWAEHINQTVQSQNQNLNLNADVDIDKVKLINDEIELKEF